VKALCPFEREDMIEFQIFGIAALAVLGYMTILWAVSLIRKDASIVDIFWGLGFVLVTAVYFRLASGFAPRKFLLLALVAIWGARLTIHIMSRNLGKGEDRRYQAFRSANPRTTPLLAAQTSTLPDRLTVFDVAGVALWAAGLLFEAVGDWQLARFRSDPDNNGKVLQTGLWRYSRHPNYFGEALLWWGYYFITFGVGGYWTIYSPVLMTMLLLRVSGVTLLEKSLTTSKPGYSEYVRTTSAFIPWFPRKPESVEGNNHMDSDNR
jgi:steroid 5-alpha reductase family enzyme